jgi:hypothetical protein
VQIEKSEPKGLYRRDVAPWTCRAIDVGCNSTMDKWPPPATYQALSWSWASTTADGVLWHLGNKVGQIVVDLIDVSIPLKANDLFGEISSGRIRLRGPICKFGRQIANTTGASALTAAGKSCLRDLIKTYWDSVSRSLTERSAQAQVQDMEPLELYNLYLAAGRSHTPDCLYLMAFELHNEQEQEYSRASGLIIEPALGSPDVTDAQGRSQCLEIYLVGMLISTSHFMFRCYKVMSISSRV